MLLTIWSSCWSLHRNEIWVLLFFSVWILSRFSLYITKVFFKSYFPGVTAQSVPNGFSCSPLENWYSRASDGGKGKIPLFREVATWEDSCPKGHLPCLFGAKGFKERGRHEKTEGVYVQEEQQPRRLILRGHDWTDLLASAVAVFQWSRALSSGKVLFFTPQDQSSAHLKESSLVLLGTKGLRSASKGWSKLTLKAGWNAVVQVLYSSTNWNSYFMWFVFNCYALPPPQL